MLSFTLVTVTHMSDIFSSMSIQVYTIEQRIKLTAFACPVSGNQQKISENK